MMPFEERWGRKAQEILRAQAQENGFAQGEGEAAITKLCLLAEGTLAWKIACALQEAHTTGVVEALDPNSKLVIPARRA
jgi:hypothetical protein